LRWRIRHHVGLKLVHKSSASFIYANGLLLLTVVAIPFPTALLGEFLVTESAAPAVALYALLAITAVWLPVTTAMLLRRPGSSGWRLEFG